MGAYQEDCCLRYIFNLHVGNRKGPFQPGEPLSSSRTFFDGLLKRELPRMRGETRSVEVDEGIRRFGVSEENTIWWGSPCYKRITT